MAMLLTGFIVIVGFVWLSSVCKAAYNMYEGDCLDYHVTGDIPNYLASPSGKQHQIIPFCRRDQVSKDGVEETNGASSVALFDLYQQNTTIEELYSWSAHLDLIEEYEAYRQDRTQESRSIFYNCTAKSKFGRFCQYSFDSQKPFHELVKEALTTRYPLTSMTTCYVHLNCMRDAFVWCLDWREVCDRKVDCWPKPVDEENCEQLEDNECDLNEYRCFNGQCISDVFFQDDSLNPDCLDRTDESLWNSARYPDACQSIFSTHGMISAGDPTFRCTDIACTHWTVSIASSDHPSCGADSLRSKPMENFQRHLLSMTSNSHLSKECWAAMICYVRATFRISLDDILHANLFNGSCENVCSTQKQPCHERIKQRCPTLFEFPASPLGWKQAHLVYQSNRTMNTSNSPDYLCYDEESCSISSPVIRFRKLSDPSILLACELFTSDKLVNDWALPMPFSSIRRKLTRQCSSPVDANLYDCSRSTQFSCGKVCLSKHRLVDNFVDCLDRQDETYNDSCNLQHKHRLVCSTVLHDKLIVKCLPSNFILQGQKGMCGVHVELPHFPTLCDGFIDYHESFNGTINTDESDCDQWQCDNQYTRCDDVWNCPNGVDEAQCFHPICQGLIGHPCILRNISELICLPLRHVNDRVIDCFGATDERSFCEKNQNGENTFLCLTYRSDQQTQENQTYTCQNPHYVCDSDVTCLSDDEKPRWLCRNGPGIETRCGHFWVQDRRISRENLICTLDESYRSSQAISRRMPYFSLANSSIMPAFNLSWIPGFINKRDLSLHLTEPLNSFSDFACRGGIAVLFHGQRRCLCPPTQYGSFCEYQSQRVSMSIQIGTPEWRTAFILLVYLIDDGQGVINSHHSIRYLSIRDCSKKFHFHLLYSSQPKLVHSTYSVRIDVFEMSAFKYRGSWSFPILFPFLPVYRLPVRLTILGAFTDSSFDCSLKCHPKRSQCVAFVNNGQHFCRCRPGWSGVLCDKSYQVDCSPNALSVGTSNNRSICMCPMDKDGRRCYLPNLSCQKKTAKQCLNAGQCIPGDSRTSPEERTACSCAERFDGDRCQLNETQIDIDLAISNLKDSLLIHLIAVNSHPSAFSRRPSQHWGPHDRSTTFKPIQVHSNLVTIFWSKPFHLIFVEHDKQIYLAYIEPNYIPQTRILIKVEARHRCPSIVELLDEQIVHSPRLRRVKNYHIPCQNQSDLRCFHDDDQYLCLCTADRRANCLTFDHRMQSDCQQLSFCENGGRCFQNAIKCPTAALCACPECYLGRRCQLSTKGFGLPLDVILGYQILPEVSFFRQPVSVINTGWITLLIFTFGLINGLLSSLTFGQKHVRVIGASNYLYIASINSLLIMVMFLFKYLLLVLTQLFMRNNRSLIYGQCLTLDFALKISLQIEDWLYACVVIERLVSVLQETRFSKRNSRKWSRYISGLILTVVIGTSIHEPLHRTLIDDDDQGRVWCIVRYTKKPSANFFHQLTSIGTVIHLICPVALNLIAAVGIILLRSTRRSKIAQKLSFRGHIIDQLRQQKYSIISPMLLILAAIPRLILTFQLKCMKSARDPVSIFLFAYFISFLPSVLLFVTFVLPSTTYRKEFHQVMNKLSRFIHSAFV